MALIFLNSIEIESIVGGDNLIPSISAASIVAKVYRDRLMMTYSKEFPNMDLINTKDIQQNFTRKCLKDMV